MIHTETIKEFTIYWIAFALILFPILLFIKQPYGRHMQKGWGISISNKTGWIIMEMPSLVIFGFMFIYNKNYIFSVALPALLWIIHYFNRTLIFPFRIKTKGKKMPLIIAGSAIFFNVINASLNGILLNTPVVENPETSMTRLIIGMLLFAGGMFINIFSDNLLIQLRKTSTNGYQIPQKFLFRYVSCPNFLGEIIEWTGFAILAGNLAALAFLVWTIVNLIPRAISHHKWYKQKFEEYPKNRKAVIPFIL